MQTTVMQLKLFRWMFYRCNWIIELPFGPGTLWIRTEFHIFCIFYLWFCYGGKKRRSMSICMRYMNLQSPLLVAFFFVFVALIHSWHNTVLPEIFGRWKFCALISKSYTTLFYFTPIYFIFFMVHISNLIFIYTQGYCDLCNIFFSFLCNSNQIFYTKKKKAMKNPCETLYYCLQWYFQQYLLWLL